MNIKLEDLVAFNSYGGFNKEGNEYVILNQNTPLPWCNILANPSFGTVISNKGVVYTYFKNSREFKISNWSNDWVSFTPGETFTGIFETGSNEYNLKYGFGYVQIIEEESIKKKMDIFVPINMNAKVHIIELENTSNKEEQRRISYKIDAVLGVSKDTHADFVISKVINDKLCIKNPYNDEFSNNIVYTTVVSDKTDLINVEYDEKTYTTNVFVNLKPNKKTTFAIILGVNETSEEKIDEDLEKIKNIFDIQKMYDETINYWKKLVTKKFDTKNKYIDIMANGWLLYQTIVCRLFARTGFFQAGGAIGFRDQLQDTLALIRTWPNKTRDQIILHSSKQFEKGDVLHWWHEHNNAGIRTYFSDDYLWLPYVLSEYINITNDISILDVKTKYLEDKPMENKRELYEVFNNIIIEDSVYEHAKKAITYGLSRISIKNGLLNIGDGDWNDGFSNIRGQSVWLTFFMMNILERFEKIAKIKEDTEMIDLCIKSRHRFKHSILSNAWDDGHFVRAFFENGEVLGASKNKECKIDLISQAWAVIAMKDYPDVQDELKEALNAADKYLVDRKNNIVRLLYPSFDNPKNNPGYIKAYVPGTRENGGQYTHASIWLAKAYFELNEKDRAIEILNILNPINHSDTREKADIYMGEPYVVAADVYTNPEHIGRAGWTWYTGSASWMYKVIEDYMGNNKK